MGVKEILKREPMSADCDKKKPNMIVIWIIIAAIVILAFGSFKNGDSKKNSRDETVNAVDTEEYAREQERRLEQTLKKINGAGDVSVFISIEGGGEKVPARNIKNKVKEKPGDSAEGSCEEENESNVVLSGKSSGGEPYIVEEKTPDIAGVLVVAAGASDERVRLEIYEAVRALYGMAAHRIKVTY